MFAKLGHALLMVVRPVQDCNCGAPVPSARNKSRALGWQTSAYQARIVDPTLQSAAVRCSGIVVAGPGI